MDKVSFYRATIEYVDNKETRTVTLCVCDDLDKFVVGDKELPEDVDDQIFFYFESVAEMKDGQADFKVLDYVNVTTSFKSQHSLSTI